MDALQPTIRSPRCTLPRCTLPRAVAPGDGDAELEEDGTLAGEIRSHRGDESSFSAADLIMLRPNGLVSDRH
jgi:hypothetical protein